MLESKRDHETKNPSMCAHAHTGIYSEVSLFRPPHPLRPRYTAAGCGSGSFMSRQPRSTASTQPSMPGASGNTTCCVIPALAQALAEVEPMQAFTWGMGRPGSGPGLRGVCGVGVVHSRNQKQGGLLAELA